MAKSFRTDTVLLGSSGTPPALTAGTADPTAGGGVSAEVGSFYYQVPTSIVWQKMAASSTAWVPMQPSLLFGDGSDGNVTISGGTTTLARDMYYNNLTVDGTGVLDPDGFRIWVRGTLTVQASGIISMDGANATNNNGASQNVAGTWGVSGGGGGNSTTTNGVAGSSTTNNPVSFAGAGGAGGNAGANTGGAGGTSAVTAANRGLLRNVITGTLGTTIGNTLNQVSWGPGGGGGAGDGANSGGGGGAGGGGVIITAREILNSGTIRARGGNGHTPTVGNTGGGGGGSGGLVVLGYHYFAGSAAVVTGGSGGNGVGTGLAGSAGTSGLVITLQD